MPSIMANEDPVATRPEAIELPATPAVEVTAPAQEPISEVPVPAESKFETVAVPLRTEAGAEVRRMKTKEAPDRLKSLADYLLGARQTYLEDFAAKVKSGELQGRPPMDLVLDQMIIRYDKEPNRRVRLMHAVNTYAIITEVGENLVLRLYAMIPAPFSNAAMTLLKQSPEPIEVSKDSFIRPSGI